MDELTTLLLTPSVGGPVVGSILVGIGLGIRRDRPLMGGLLGLLGPVGWGLTVWWKRAGDVVCDECGRFNVPSPQPARGPGMSEPHFRCRRCGNIIWGC